MKNVFDDPSQTWSLVTQMLWADRWRGQNRELINQLFNSNPPYTQQEAKENRLETNISWGEPSRIAMQARNSFTNAICKSATYFTVSCDFGDSATRQLNTTIITNELNKILKRDQRLRKLFDGRFAQCVLHGISPVTWMRDRDWCPKLRGVEDVLVPTGTLRDLSNLDFFAVYSIFTAKQLEEMTSGDTVDKAWNVPMVKRILARLKELAGTLAPSSRWIDWQYPEKIGQDLQEKSTYYGADSTPAIRFYDIYFAKEVDGKIIWCRRMIVDKYNDIMGQEPSDEFVFDSGDRSYGESLDQIMHVQFADGTNVAPFRWHTVKSLGFLLYGPCHFLNRYRCRLNDAAFEALNWYFQVQGAGDKERIQNIDLFHLGIIPEGVTIVPQDQRAQINWQVASGIISSFRQVVGEHSASYLQPQDSSNPQREMTATEVVAQVNQSAALLTAMLEDAYQQSVSLYREITRRFFTIDHPDCKKFRERCEEEGVDPSIWDRWEDVDIEPTRITGSGIKTLELSMLRELVQNIGLYAPAGRQEIIHRYTLAATDDAGFTNRIAPMEAMPPSSSVQLASTQWATLMTGMPVAITEGVNLIEWVNTLLQMLVQKVSGYEQSQSMPDMTTLQGLMNVANTISGQIQAVAVDKRDKQWAKQAMDQLGQVANLLKAYGQRLQQQAQAQQGPQQDPTMLKAMADIQVQQAKADAEERRADARFVQETQHKQLRNAQDLEMQKLKTGMKLQHGIAKAAITQADASTGGAE